MARSYVHYEAFYRNKLTNKPSAGVESYTTEDLEVVGKVVNDLVEYVVRKEELEEMDIPFDDDAVPSVECSSGTTCPKEYCSRGCVCTSLLQTKTTTHCRKEDCIFKCICDRRMFYSLRKLPHRTMDKQDNPKDQTEGVKNPKELPRNAKSPKKKSLSSSAGKTVEDIPLIDLSMDDAPEIIEIPEEEPIEISDAEISDAEISDVEISDVEDEEVKTKPRPIILSASFDSLQTSDRKKLDKLSYERTRRLGLPEMFVWCMMHRRYNCRCTGSIFDMRTGVLLRHPTMEPTSSNFLRHEIFDLQRHTARTFGSWFDYRLRNSSYLYGVKRCVEISNDVLSNTNSFFKIDVPLQNGAFEDSKDRTESEATSAINGHSKDRTESEATSAINGHSKDRTESEATSAINGHSKDRTESEATYAINGHSKDRTESEATSAINGHSKDRAQLEAIVAINGHSKASIGERTPRRRDSINESAEKCLQVILNNIESEGSPAGKDEQDKHLPMEGLLCLNHSFGYLPIKQFTEKKLVFQNPINKSIFVCTNNIPEANKWLNDFFKKHMIFESAETNLKWVVVQKGVLKTMKPFNKALIEEKSKIINSQGFLIELKDAFVVSD